jgi:uncharacterized membrane protein YvbJ
MFCPKCGAQNADDATFCQKCGIALGPGSPTISPYSASAPSTNRAPSGKSPIVAAILNLIFGIGYLYLGYKKVLGVQTMLFVVILVVAYFVVGFFTFGIISLIIAIVLAIDGYQKGQGEKGFISAEL